MKWLKRRKDHHWAMRKHLLEYVQENMTYYGSSIFKRLWWRFMTGHIALLPWTFGDLIDSHGEWLEANIGKQGFDWAWGQYYGFEDGPEKLLITLRKGKGKHLTMALLQWPGAKVY